MTVVTARREFSRAEVRPLKDLAVVVQITVLGPQERGHPIEWT
jgi:hypothetical protein